MSVRTFYHQESGCWRHQEASRHTKDDQCKHNLMLKKTPKNICNHQRTSQLNSMPTWHNFTVQMSSESCHVYGVFRWPSNIPGRLDADLWCARNTPIMPVITVPHTSTATSFTYLSPWLLAIAAQTALPLLTVSGNVYASSHNADTTFPNTWPLQDYNYQVN